MYNAFRGVLDTVTFANTGEVPETEDLNDEMPFTKEMVEGLQELTREQELTIANLTREYERKYAELLEQTRQRPQITGPPSSMPPPAEGTTDVDTAQAEMAELRQINAKLQEDHSNALVEQAKSSKRLAQLEARAEVLTSSLEQYRTQETYYKEKETELSAMRMQNKQLLAQTDRSKEAETEVSRLQDLVREQGDQLVSVRSELLRQSASQTAKENADRSNDDQATLLTEMQQLRHKNNQQAQQVSMLESSMASLEAESSRAQEQTSVLLRTVSDLKQQLSDVQQTGSGSGTADAETKMKQQFKSDMTKVLQKLVHVTGVSKQLQASVQTLETEKQELEGKCVGLEAELETARGSVTTMATAQTGLQQENGRLQKQLVTMQQQVRKVQAQKKALSDKVAQKLEMVKARTAKKDTKIAVLTQRVKELEIQLTVARQ